MGFDDSAIHEINRSRGLVDLLRSAGQSTALWSEPAEALFEEVRRSLDTALSILRPSVNNSDSLRSSPSSSSPEGRRSVKRSSSSPQMEGEGNGVSQKKSRKNMEKIWSNITNQPFDDGFQWRKYGEKEVQGKQFRRSYYRCTYKTERGCLATKQVQWPVNDSQSMFFVTYSNNHTCQDTVIRTTPSISNSDHGGSIVLSSDQSHHHHHHQQEREVKRETSPNLSSMENNNVTPEEHTKESDGSSADDALFDGMDPLSSRYYYPMSTWDPSNHDLLMDFDGFGDGSSFYGW